MQQYLPNTLSIEEEILLSDAKRLGRKKPDSENKARPICVQFMKFNQKQQVLSVFRKKKRESGANDANSVHMKEDFCEDVREIRKKLYPFIEKARTLLGEESKIFMRHDTIHIEDRLFTFDLKSNVVLALDKKNLPDWMKDDRKAQNVDAL